MNVQSLDQIRKVAEEASNREGCYLYDLEFVGAGGNRALRVYIDKDTTAPVEVAPETDEAVGTGASIEDCSKVSRSLSEFLEANEETIAGGAYSLEVSTPGLERVLKEPRHFEKAVGKKILARTFQGIAELNPNLDAEALKKIGKAKQVQGTLKSFNESGFAVEQDGFEVTVPFESVTKAHVVFEFDAGNAPGPKNPNKGKSKK